jgi:hypothetical protein
VSEQEQGGVKTERNRAAGSGRQMRESDRHEGGRRGGGAWQTDESRTAGKETTRGPRVFIQLWMERGVGRMGDETAGRREGEMA